MERTFLIETNKQKQGAEEEFSSYPVVKNPPGNVGDMGSIPIQEDPTCHGANKSVHHNWARVLQQEKPLQWEAYASQLESSPCSPQLEKAHTQQREPNTAKIK